MHRISIHASRGGSDVVVCIRPWVEIISIHASRGGSDCRSAGFLHHLSISIHASRGGSDNLPGCGGRLKAYFNPRFPRGKRPSFWAISSRTQRFQSTLPAGEATVRIFVNPVGGSISIHASRGGSDLAICINTSIQRWYSGFQSTLPAGEATSPVFSSILRWHRFQSTLPAGEATTVQKQIETKSPISIHASRGGSDGNEFISISSYYISIHASRGGSDLS